MTWYHEGDFQIVDIKDRLPVWLGGLFLLFCS